MVVCSENFNKDDFFWGHLGNKRQDTAVPPEAVTDGDCACELPNYPEEGEYDEQDAARALVHLQELCSSSELNKSIQTPTKAEWERLAEGFASRWLFLNCLGAVDGKHVAIVSPPNSGSKFFYYKCTFSIVLMAVVDSECKYVLVDVGAKESDFGRDLTDGCLDIPPLGSLPGTSTNVPYVFVGDEALQLRKDFMRPYPAKQLDDGKRIFNYRLSRCTVQQLYE
ncbi:uncharacterized protein LOC119405932 [Rhipicephalus sanguineus]|uniref:uncharacterized protein LOC119405932 n=1 Tax=Rhipicephalus sanguineus TaxID=34632 RepID=UPI0020C2AC3C|nr:uncharacterized protein LOC119405932 [Rhipicephalus sanguineus]